MQKLVNRFNGSTRRTKAVVISGAALAPLVVLSAVVSAANPPVEASVSTVMSTTTESSTTTGIPEPATSDEIPMTTIAPTTTSAPATTAAPTTTAPPTTTAAPTTTVAPTTTAPATLPPAPLVGAAIIVTDVVDGDTIDTDIGTIRILGYDTPERGECGYDTATQALSDALSAGTVTLTTDSGDDTDRYDRLLRHVLVDGEPVGLSMISAGMANARYDSLDGYPRHRYQDDYRAADGPNVFQCAAAPAPEPAPAPAPAPAEQSDERVPDIAPSGPDLDCGDIGRTVWVGSNDYHRLDRDGDGWGCDSYS